LNSEKEEETEPASPTASDKAAEDLAKANKLQEEATAAAATAGQAQAKAEEDANKAKADQAEAEADSEVAATEAASAEKDKEAADEHLSQARSEEADAKSKLRDTAEGVEAAEADKQAAHVDMEASIKAIADKTDLFEQSQFNAKQKQEVATKLATSAKLAAQDSDFATTQQEQKQVDLDNAEKEVKGATANLLKQEDNKKAIEEMHKLAREKDAEEEEQLQMDEQDAGQRAAAVEAGPVEDTNESSQSLVDTAAATEDAASTEVHELGNDDKLEDLMNL